MPAAETIRKLRLALGLHQYEFCKEVGVEPGTISNWEMGRRFPKLPFIRKMVEIAKKNKVKMKVEDFLN